MTIAIPVARTTRLAGAKKRSPTKAAWRAIVAISSGFRVRSARSARTVTVSPPPTQKTAKLTWTTLKIAYQFDGSLAWNANTRPTMAIARPIAAVMGPREGGAEPALRRVESPCGRVNAIWSDDYKLRAASTSSSRSGSSLGS
jgi:hypothetical protein